MFSKIYVFTRENHIYTLKRFSILRVWVRAESNIENLIKAELKGIGTDSGGGTSSAMCNIAE
jgi:hypothetical protein